MDHGDVVRTLDTDGIPHLRIDCACPLSAELVARVESLSDRADGGAAVVLLTGSPQHGWWPGEVDIHLVGKWEKALRRLESLPAGTIAVADGECGGPALEVLLATDYRIAADDLLLRPPATGGQLWPGMALHRLANQVGVARARRLALFGFEVSAARAEQAGLIDEITCNLADSLDHAVKTVGGLTGSEVAIRRRLLLDAVSTSFEESLGTHLAACDRMLRRVSAADAAGVAG